MTSRKLSLLAIMLLGGASLLAAPLTPDEALARAIGKAPARVASSLSAGRPTLSFTYNINKTPALYVFTTPQSFMLVAADDAVTPLIGYSDNSTFDPDNIPDGLKWYLEARGAEISAASKSSGAVAAIYAPADRQNIEPLLKTTWRQGNPFNMNAPFVGESQCPIGCVAISMSQTMNYYQWPEKGIGSHSYSWTPSGGTAQKLSFNYEENPFLWNEMLDDYSDGKGTEAQKKAVANLTYGSAVSVDTKFGASASSAGANEICRAFVNRFNYSIASRFAEHKYYTAEEWSELIYQNLLNQRPTPYAGTNDNGGHAFVVDGYNTDGYFHVNWGWGGTSDGYYLINNLNPRTQGTGGTSGGYNFGESVVLDLKKPEAGDKLAVVMVNQGGLKVTTGEAQFNIQTSTGAGGFFNFSTRDLENITLGATLTNTETGEVIYVPGKNYDKMESFIGYGSYRAVPTEKIPDGKYILRPAYLYEGEWGEIQMPYNYTRTYTITVDGDSYIPTADTPQLLEVSDIKIESNFYDGAAFKMSFKLTNTNDYTYSGGVALQIGKLNGQNLNIVTRSAYTPVEIGINETIDVDYTTTFIKNVPEGSYSAFLVDYAGNRIIKDPLSITVVGTADGVPHSSNLSVKNSDNVNPSNIEVYGDMFLKKGNYFANSLYLYFFDGETGKSVTRITTPIYFVTEDDFIHFEITGLLEDAKVGGEYLAGLYLGSTLISNYPTFKVGDFTGVETIDGDSAAVVKTEYFTLTGVRVNEGNLQKGIYIKKEYLDNAETRTSRVIIR